MANFDVSQTFRAIDRFSPVIKRIQNNTAKLTRKINESRKSIKKFGASVRSIGTRMTAFATLPIALLGGSMIKAASDAEESASKFETVFKDMSSAASKSAADLSRSFGLSRTESKKLLGDTGDLLTGFGFTQEAALKMSNEVNRLAVDLASFTNVQGGAKTASAALTKALLGERESIKSLGISILEEDVKARVKQLVLVDKMKFASLRQAKAFATLQLATEQSGNAIGDFARTQNSAANLTRIAAAAGQDLKETFGKVLLPIYVKVIKKVTEFMRRLEDTSPKIKKIILVVAALVAAAGPLVLIIGGLVAAFLFLTSPIGLIVIAIAALIAGVTTLAIKFKPAADIMRIGFESVRLVIDLLILGFKIFKETISNLLPDFQIFSDISEGIGSFFQNFNFGGVADKIKGIRESLSAPEASKGGGVAAQEVRTQTRLDGQININAPAGVVSSASAKVTGAAAGNLGLNMAGAGA